MPRATGRMMKTSRSLLFGAAVSMATLFGAATLRAEPMAPERARNVIAAEASRIVQALKSRDMNRLSKLVHPVKGVRFSPYADVDAKGDVRLTAAMIRKAFGDTRIRLWGSYDGSANPIRLSFAGYYKRFVYDRDFARASEISYNNKQHGGNSLDNSREKYPDAIIVEYYGSGPAGQKDLGFRILRLVFEPYRESWYLIHIIHDEWTI
jgi:hypothetical protein